MAGNLPFLVRMIFELQAFVFHDLNGLGIIKQKLDRFGTGFRQPASVLPFRVNFFHIHIALLWNDNAT